MQPALPRNHSRRDHRITDRNQGSRGWIPPAPVFLLARIRAILEISTGVYNGEF